MNAPMHAVNRGDPEPAMGDRPVHRCVLAQDFELQITLISARPRLELLALVVLPHLYRGWTIGWLHGRIGVAHHSLLP